MRAYLRPMTPPKQIGNERQEGIRKKGEGTGVMVSAFLMEEFGFYLLLKTNF